MELINAYLVRVDGKKMIYRAVSQKPTAERASKTPPQRTKPIAIEPPRRELPEPIECPFNAGPRLNKSGEPDSIKCGCAMNLTYPVHVCSHPSKVIPAFTSKRTGRIIAEQPGRCLPTIAVVPPASHVSPAYYTACFNCPLNPNYQEPQK